MRRTCPNIVGFADGDLSIFLMIRMGNVFLEGKLQRKVPFSLHHTKDRYYQYDLFFTLTLIAEIVFVSFLHCKVIVFPLHFHTGPFGRKSPYPALN